MGHFQQCSNSLLLTSRVQLAQESFTRENLEEINMKYYSIQNISSPGDSPEMYAVVVLVVLVGYLILGLFTFAALPSQIITARYQLIARGTVEEFESQTLCSCITQLAKCITAGSSAPRSYQSLGSGLDTPVI